MSFCNRIVLPVVAVFPLAFLIACGSSSNKSTPPPTGAFSNSNLNGTYVFSTLGADATVGAPVTIVGAFTACGCSGGTISGGTFSFFDPAVGSPASAQTISGGNYSVTSDGRGQANLMTSLVGKITLDFVLNSSAGGLVTEYDVNGTGSGTLDQQTSVTQSEMAGSYAFSVGGQSNLTTTPEAFASAGAFTLSATGGLTAGIYDVTNETFTGGASSPGGVAGIALNTGSSSVTVGTGTTPGTAIIVDANTNAYQFDVYPISLGHLKLIETDGAILSSGDAFTQATSLPSGTLAFTMGGLDNTGLPLALGGLLPVSGGSISGGTEDFNDDGNVNTATAVTGSFGALSGGRATLGLGAFANGGAQLASYTFAAYPTSNGTIVLEVDNAGISAGSLLVQTNTSFASAQGYGVDLSAINIFSGPQFFFEEDDIAEFTSSTSGFTGLVDVNDQGSTSFDKMFDGSYSQLSTGRYSFTANTSSGFAGFSGAFYTVDGSTFLFVEGDNGQVGTGIFQIQNASGAASKAALARFSGVIPKLAAHQAAKRLSK